LDYTTYRRWINRGQQEECGPYRMFCDAVDESQAKAEVEILNRWVKHTANDWKACRDLLERRFRDRWSRNDKVELSGNLSLNHDIDSDIERLLGQMAAGGEVPAQVETSSPAESVNPVG
jgi:hypothetical protein